MKIDLIITNLSKKWLVFYIILYASLIVSLIVGENSTGGAIIDYKNQKEISKDFSINFYDTLFNFDKYSTRHSPVLIIFLSIFEKLNLHDLLIRFLHLNLTLILPLYFFKSLNLIIKDKNIIFFLVSLILISPTFRSLAVWPDSRVLGLTFFLISIYEFIKFKQDKEFTNCVKNIIFLAIAAYISPNFSLFSIFYFLEFFIYYKKSLKHLFIIILANLMLAFPAFVYLLSLDSNFLLKTAATNLDQRDNTIFKNFYNNILLIVSIIFFYLIPFYFFKIIKINKKYFIKNSILALILTFFCVLFFDYKYSYTGGGIFFKFSYYLFENNLFFYLISCIGIFFLFNLINFNYKNFVLFLVLLLGNPQITVYHKYYDPLIIILLFTIFNIKIDNKPLENYKNQIYIFLYFFLFLIINILKNYV